MRKLPKIYFQEIEDLCPTPFKSPVEPFAKQEAMLHLAGRQADKGILYFWQLEKTVILGMVDLRLPYLEEAKAYLENQGYQLIARNSGGLAVVNDDQVLDLSFAIAQPEDNKLSIDEGYDIMMELISGIINLDYPDAKIEAYEIPDSYCPGSYDLSINGLKFAGISQRRTADAILVNIYLSIDGNQNGRGELIREFYQIGLKDEENKWGFPDVNPSVMGNINDILGANYTVQGFIDRTKDYLQENNHSLIPFKSDELFNEDYDKSYHRMIRRNRDLAD